MNHCSISEIKKKAQLKSNSETDYVLPLLLTQTKLKQCWTSGWVRRVRTDFLCWRKWRSILKMFLFPLRTCQDVHLLTLWLKVAHQATYLIYATTQSVHSRKLIWFSKLSTLEGKLSSTLIFETFVIRFQVFLKLSQSYQRQVNKSIVNSLSLKWSTSN